MYVCLLTLTLIALLAKAPEIQQTKHVTSHILMIAPWDTGTYFLFGFFAFFYSSASFKPTLELVIIFRLSSSDLCDRRERDVIFLTFYLDLNLPFRLRMNWSQLQTRHTFMSRALNSADCTGYCAPVKPKACGLRRGGGGGVFPEEHSECTLTLIAVYQAARFYFLHLCSNFRNDYNGDDSLSLPLSPSLM